MSDNPIPEENGASSLRAAALLTLKSKRRKPVVDTSGIPGPSQRPPTTDTSVQLDYGQEDIGSSPTDVEGEISDSEDSPSKNASKPAPDPAAVVVKVESPTHNLLDRTGDSPPPGLSPPTPVPLAEYIIDADHVRPGLSMNQDQYDTAKDIVLDLLGWGVPPDYLVDCNLSREIVYYVFSELNLRLPQNLDTTGLIPYTPAHVALLSRPLPPPAAPRSLHGHPSLPPKPHVGPNSATASGPSPVQRSTAPSPPQPSSPPSASSPTSSHQNSAGSLHDMERQRRQELLARKAVQASRKVKPPSDASSTASSSFAPADPSDVAQDQDVEMTPAVATEAVDDFLKTIGEKKSVTPEASVPLQSTNDTMDIDEIPGLGGSASSQSQMPTYSDQVVTSPAESSFSAAQTQSLSQSDPPPSSGESGSTTFGLEHAGYIEQLSHQQALQRRGAKRPTAADFVDFDSGSRNGYGNGSAPLLRRKTASFASVSGHRKLVIDLSDSEGEGEDYVMHDSVDSERWEAGSGYSSPVPGRAVATPVSAGGAGWATPPIGGNMTPAALMEKEQEIRKMRELIAQREKSRMQKVMSRSSTNTSMEFPKREEDEGPMSSSSLANGSTVSLNGNGSHVHQEDDNRALNDSVTAASASCSTPPHIGSHSPGSHPPTSD
ncbi:hypothetical protein C8J57DRAFT_1494554 [Mycena rebaudengoi]|nr:hypothetical protein C8J57DRAFT_1494554 [Mycena rebaudengoi]